MTFSLYCNNGYNSGLCRVSDKSNVLRELFNGGMSVKLSSAILEATIKLTSPGTFNVVGQVLKSRFIEASGVC